MVRDSKHEVLPGTLNLTNSQNTRYTRALHGYGNCPSNRTGQRRYP
jgi:hypothetical protein